MLLELFQSTKKNHKMNTITREFYSHTWVISPLDLKNHTANS